MDSANTATHTIEVNGFIGKPQITTRSEEELLFVNKTNQSLSMQSAVVLF